MNTVLKIALGLLFAAVVLVSTGCGDEKSSSSSNPDEAHEAESEPPAEARCFAAWNESENNLGTRVASSYARQGTVYVNVGLDDTFGRCLVTLAVPDFDTAQQFSESSGQNSAMGAFVPGASGTTSDLPASVKGWNATVDSDGSLVPGAPSSQPQPAATPPPSEDLEIPSSGASADAGVDQTEESTSSSPVAAEESGTFKQCDPNITALKGTTNCAFASNVFYEYWNSDQAENVRAYSSIAGQYFRLRCAAEDDSVVCRTSERGVVKFPQSAVDSYSREQAQRYARSHDVGP